MNEIKIALIQPDSPFLAEPLSFPSLGLLYISSYLKQFDLNVEYIDLTGGKTISDIDADIVGISATTSQFKDACDIKEKMNVPNRKFVIGGSHASFSPTECIENGFHVVIRGEGEKSILKAISEFPNIPQNIYMPDEVIDLNSLIPDWEAIDLKFYKWKLNGKKCLNMITSRGNCPFNRKHCSFCPPTDPTPESKLRFRSVEHVLYEAKMVKENYGIGSLAIYDDNVLINKKRDFKIFDGLHNLEMDFRCMTRSDLANKDDLRKLKEYGCGEICVGVESADEYIHNEIIKKGTTLSNDEKFVKRCKDINLNVKTYFIIGLPSETRESALKIKKWLLKNKPDNFDISIFVPYKSSEIYKNKEKFDIEWNENELQDLWYNGTPQFGEAVIKTSELSSEDIVQLRDEILEEVPRGEGGVTDYWGV